MSEQTFTNRLKNAWNVFKLKNNPLDNPVDFGSPTIQFNSFGLGSSYRPGVKRLSVSNERSIVASLYNHIAIDVAASKINHVKTDKNGKFLEVISSSLNDCLTTEANIDQTGRQLIQDAVLSMFDEGVVAIVPVDTNVNLTNTSSFDILSMRTGQITQWYPKYVKINLYNDKTGMVEEITLPKEKVAIIENPFYSVMNEPNSTLKRLVHKLNLLDMIDDQSGSAKLDIILQLPYTIKTPARRQQAEERRRQIEEQLEGSKYGIAYTDGTEKITQLNRSIDNNLMGQIETLQNTLYSQIGITKDVFDGTANEETMLNYQNRTIEPILAALTGEMRRKFLTKTARTQGQDIMFFKDSFKLVPVNQLADIADKFTRNEILSSNEMRSVIGYRPVDDPKADELRNKNINQSVEEEFGGNIPVTTEADTGYGPSEEVGDMAESPDDILGQIAEIEEYLNMLYDTEGVLDDEEEEIKQFDMDQTEDYFAHYASKYYDPVKAHEYYERTKKLKGRSAKRPSTSTLNDRGKSAAQVVRENVNKERSTEVAKQKQIMNNKVAELRSRLKTVGKMRRGEERAKIEKEVQKLAEQFSAVQEQLKEKYEDIYDEELRKMNADSEFAGASKSSGSSKSSSKSSKKSSSKKTSSKAADTSGNKWDKIISDYWKRRNAKK